MTAAATTGPNSDPRPTSSTPATNCAPAAQARFSNLRVQRNFFRRRSLMVAAETAEFEAFDAWDFEADLDTEADQHLRRSRHATQGHILCGSGASPGLDGASPVTTQLEEPPLTA